MEKILYLSSDSDIEKIVENVVSRLKPDVKETDSLLTTSETLEFLKITKPTLHRLRESGVISAIKLGGSIRYRKSDIDKLIKQTQL